MTGAPEDSTKSGSGEAGNQKRQPPLAGLQGKGLSPKPWQLNNIW